MRVVTHCDVCGEARAKAGGSRAAPVYLEVNEDGVAIGACPNGHPISWTVQQPRYATLFDWACLALTDGYCREAVASFAASLERFHEIAIVAIADHLEIPRAVIQDTWNQNTKLSERQFGAFAFLYAALTKRVPPKWDQKRTQFRNDVVHNGKFASFEEARDYGEACYDRIHAIGAEMRTLCMAEWTGEYFRQSNERAAKHKSAVMAHISFSAVRTITERDAVPFDEARAEFLRNNWWRPGANEPAPLAP